MYTLYLDSSDKNMSIGITKDNVLIAHFHGKAWQKQSELMTKVLDDLFFDNKINPKNIKEIVVGIGPGSYTGVRIALTIAKVFAFSLNIPIYPISSLRLLADFDKPSICIINARSERSYVGVYNKEEIILNDSIIKNEQVLIYIKEHPEFILRGDILHLGMKQEVKSPIETMIKLRPFLKEAEDILTIKPCYMKEL